MTVSTALLAVHTSLLAQSGDIPTVDIKVLAWNKTIDAIDIQTIDGPQAVNARRGQISAAFTVPLESELLLLESRGENASPAEPPPSVRLQLPIPTTVKEEGLLLIAESQGELLGVIVPFSEDSVPYDSLTIFNFTQFPVAAEIDAVRQPIPPRNRVSVPYEHIAVEKEALKTRFAVKTDDGWDLVQNGFIPTVPNGRVLFFISEDMPSAAARRLRPVRFTYVFEVQASEEAQRARDAINPVDPNVGYEPAPF